MFIDIDRAQFKIDESQQSVDLHEDGHHEGSPFLGMIIATPISLALWAGIIAAFMWR